MEGGGREGGEAGGRWPASWEVGSISDGGRARAATVAGREGSTAVGREREREDGGREGERERMVVGRECTYREG